MDQIDGLLGRRLPPMSTRFEASVTDQVRRGVLGVVVFAAQGHGDGVVVVVAVADAGLKAGGVGVKGLDKAGAGEAAGVVLGRARPAEDLGEGSGGERVGGVDVTVPSMGAWSTIVPTLTQVTARRTASLWWTTSAPVLLDERHTGFALQRPELLGQRGGGVAEGRAGATTPR